MLLKSRRATTPIVVVSAVGVGTESGTYTVRIGSTKVVSSQECGRATSSMFLHNNFTTDLDSQRKSPSHVPSDLVPQRMSPDPGVQLFFSIRW